MILGRYLDAELEVLPDVGRQHGPQTLQRVVDGQRAEEVDQPLEIGSERRHAQEMNETAAGLKKDSKKEAMFTGRNGASGGAPRG